MGTKNINGNPNTYIDNRWVILNNPYLLRKFKSHINIEYFHTVASVKYLFLYHFKGEDMITISEIDPLDEVKKYQTQRYLSSSYCYWRIAEFDMVQIKLPVLQLNINLP